MGDVSEDVMIVCLMGVKVGGGVFWRDFLGVSWW